MSRYRCKTADSFPFECTHSLAAMQSAEHSHHNSACHCHAAASARENQTQVPRNTRAAETARPVLERKGKPQPQTTVTASHRKLGCCL